MDAFGEDHAHLYDELLGDLPDVEEIVGRLAGRGSVLELGSGTGRLAIPLAAAGCAVTAVEISAAMLATTREKPGADALKLVQADITDLDLGETYDSVLLSRNTLLQLLEPEQQCAALAAAGRHLAPDGRLYVDLGVPKPDDDTAVHFAGTVGGRVVLHHRVHDTFRQRIAFRRIIVGGPGPATVLPSASRYTWPDELDLMATLAGLTRTDRWEDFTGTPYTRSSATFVSVYARG